MQWCSSSIKDLREDFHLADHSNRKMFYNTFCAGDIDTESDSSDVNSKAVCRLQFSSAIPSSGKVVCSWLFFFLSVDSDF